MAKEIIDSVEKLEEELARVREAHRKFSTYTQEQVDKIFLAAAKAANMARIPLAKMAVEETGMGVVEDKIIKNHYAAEYIYNKYKNTKTCGVIDEDKAYGTKRIAEPLGVICAVIPTTNPTSTAIFKTLISLKTRNGIIISPHPRAKKSTAAAAKIVLDAAVAAGAPENIISWIDAPSLDMTNLLMKEADIILATGGPGMVKAAYSSGKPALGVGAGNTPAIIDESADILKAVNSIIHSKTFDNGMICASEQSTIVDKKIYKEVRKEFEYRGCYFLKKDELDKVRKTIIINGALNAKIVGQKPVTIAALAGVKIPEDTKVLIGEVESVDLSEEFAHEKLSPVLAMYKSENFEDALAKAEKLIADGGYGHTSSIYINELTEKEKLAEFEARMKTCRVLVNTPSSFGGIGDLYNFKLAPSLTLGCGSWGGNSVSENVGVKHLINIKTVAERRENMLWFRAPEKVYFKKGCLPVALNEIKTVLGKKKAFIVTDQFLYKNGYTKCVTDKLDELGITHTTFFNVAPDPTLECAIEGTKAINSFEPDCIIAIGGGSAMDAAKIMWVMYEHPEVDFMDMAMRFMDIRKRIYTFPKMGEKAYFIAIPTSSGTGSEVQMGMAEGKSMLYLEARCLGVTRGAGVQGTQNGSVSCIGVPAAVPGGIRAVACENLIAAMLDLENASSNDQSFTHSDLRRVARSIPQFIPGTDYICSGYSSTPNYDNMFAGSNWDADDYDDWCVIQRDLRVDAGLLPAREEEVVAARNKAAKAIQALFRELGLPEITDEEVEAATYARGSQDMPDRDVVADLKAATDMLDRGVTGIDFVKALYKGGFEDVAESIFNIQKAKVVGDYLHTASMLDDKFLVISAVNCPNCYEGPMTGYQISPELWEKITDIRTAVDPAKL